MLINKKAVRQLIIGVSPHIKQVERGFFAVLDRKVKNIILSAVKTNASRKRLTQYELASFLGIKKQEDHHESENNF